MKLSLIGPVDSEEKMFEKNYEQTNGRRSDWYTIGSPMSLRLSRAKNQRL